MFLLYFFHFTVSMSLAIFIYTKLPCGFFFPLRGTINILAITALGQDGSQEIDLAGVCGAQLEERQAVQTAGWLSSHEGNQRLGEEVGEQNRSWRLGLERYKWDEQSRETCQTAQVREKTNTAIQYVSRQVE